MFALPPRKEGIAIFIKVNIRRHKRVEVIIQAVGLKIHFTIFGLTSVLLSSLIMLREVFVSSVIKIIAIYPLIPSVGTKTKIKITLISESIMFTLIEYICSPRPFSSASTAKSRYMSGTRGAISFTNSPASRLPKKYKPISLENEIKHAANSKRKQKRKRKYVSNNSFYA